MYVSHSDTPKLFNLNEWDEFGGQDLHIRKKILPNLGDFLLVVALKENRCSHNYILEAPAEAWGEVGVSQ